MLQVADHANLLTRLPTVEEVLNTHAAELGHDFVAYRNHVYRISNLCLTTLVEPFRRADWIDVTYGLRRFGLPRPFIAATTATWPDAGFHRRLVDLTIDRWWKHPLNPLPMVKW